MQCDITGTCLWLLMEWEPRSPSCRWRQKEMKRFWIERRKASGDLYATCRQPIHRSQYMHALHTHTHRAPPSFFSASSIIQRMGGMVHQIMMIAGAAASMIVKSCLHTPKLSEDLMQFEWSVYYAVKKKKKKKKKLTALLLMAMQQSCFAPCAPAGAVQKQQQLQQQQQQQQRLLLAAAAASSAHQPLRALSKTQHQRCHHPAATRCCFPAIDTAKLAPTFLVRATLRADRQSKCVVEQDVGGELKGYWQPVQTCNSNQVCVCVCVCVCLSLALSLLLPCVSLSVQLRITHGDSSQEERGAMGQKQSSFVRNETKLNGLEKKMGKDILCN